MHEGAELRGPGNGIAHGSLNLFNVLIKDSGHAVISGSRHSKITRDFQESFTGDNSEYRYMAPEMILGDAPITHGADIWSWAMITLEILADVPAFGERTKGLRIIKLLTALKRPNRAEHPKIEEYSHADELWSIFQVCWDQDPAARPSAYAIVQRLKLIQEQLGKKIRGREQGRFGAGFGRRDPPGYQGVAQPELGKATPLVVLETAAAVHSLPAQSPLSLPQPLFEPKAVLVSSRMSVEEMVESLVGPECEDVTNKLDQSSWIRTPLGGGYGDIYRGSLQDGREVAIKCPRLYVGSDDDNGGLRKIMKRAAHEMYAASKLRHPYIVQVIGVACFMDCVAIVSPWMSKGSVVAYLARTPDADRCRLCTEISSGLSYMHQEEVVHGDLKGANILVSENGVAHITDFGNATLKRHTLKFTDTLSTPGFSLRWTPLEIIKGQTGPSREADVYSLGMTILEILTGEVPFHEKEEFGSYDAICQQKLPCQPQNSIPTDSRDGNKLWGLIQRCWAKEPAKRPIATEVMEILNTITQAGLTKKQQPVALEGER